MNLYNNLKTKVYLGLILALVSIPGPVLSETWEANLDLTIPSLEMQSTSVLDSKAKREIMLGWTCCYRKELINSVRMEHSLRLIESSSREKVRKSLSTLQFNEPYTDFQLISFTTLQLLDVYTTYRGLKYDCVRELNPIVGERPSVGKMVTTKIAILYPTIIAEQQQYYISSENMTDINFLMSLVVLHNWDVVQSAKKNCTKY